MRKKYDQVSTLHVIHHGIMPMSVWFGVKFTPGEFPHGFMLSVGRLLIQQVSYFQVVTAHSLVSSTPSYTSSCTLTICWLPLDLKCKSTCGGRNT